MKRLLELLLLCAIIAITIHSCTSENEKALKELDRLVYEDPQEALAQMKKMDEQFADAKQHDKMKFALLKYKAEDKCYVPHLSDSTIKQLCEYFERHGSYREKMEVYYYMGSTYRDMGDNPLSIVWYNRAVETAESCNLEHADSMILAYVYSQMSDMYYKIGSEQKAYQFIMKSYKMLQCFGLDDLTAHESVGRMASHVDSMEVATRFYQQSALEIVSKGMVEKHSDYLGEQLGFYVRSNNRPLAEWTAGILLSMKQDSLPANAYSALGHYYQHIIHNNDSSIKYMQKALVKDERMEVKAEQARKIAVLYRKEGNDQEALRYAMDYIAFSDSAEALVEEEETKASEVQCHIAELEASRQFKKDSEMRVILYALGGGAVISLLVAIIGIILYLDSRKKLKNERILRKLKEEQEKTEQENKRLTHEIDTDRKLRAESAQDISSVMTALEEIANSPKGQLRQDSWDVIFNAVDKLYPNFRNHVLSYNDELENKELIIIYLMKMGYKQADIARITKRARSVISRKHQRLEDMLGAPISEVVKEKRGVGKE